MREKEVAAHSNILAWRILWTEEPGGLLSIGSHRVTHDRSDLACMHALEKKMATHSSILAWRIPGTEEPGGLPSVGSHRVRTRLKWLRSRPWDSVSLLSSQVIPGLLFSGPSLPLLLLTLMNKIDLKRQKGDFPMYFKPESLGWALSKCLQSLFWIACTWAPGFSGAPPWLDSVSTIAEPLSLRGGCAY